LALRSVQISFLCSSLLFAPSIFSFSGSVKCCHLHSFPTRRSSDLLSMTKGILGKKVGMTQVFGENGELIPVTVVEAAGNVENLRSEEHTSELQSRFDLVCRLLLEKKKYNLRNSDLSLIYLQRIQSD